METSPLIKKLAPEILAEVKKADSILLHCHPSPDPDSVGSALAMKWALEQLGKKVTVIKGDSVMPQAFMHFPGAEEIVPKNYFELDANQYDLFIVLDSASIDRVSSKGKIEFPASLAIVNIDHHRTNPGFGKINIVEPSYPATSQILFDLFKEWGIVLDANIAKNLFIGIYTDTGGFKYRETTVRTFQIAAELARVAPDFPSLISKMENSNSPSALAYKGLALDSIQTFHGGNVAVSAVPLSLLTEKGIDPEEVSVSEIASLLMTVTGWNIDVGMAETEPGLIKASMRTRDADRFDVSKLATAFGGGGHKSAAGALLRMTIDEAVRQVADKAKELYNL